MAVKDEKNKKVFAAILLLCCCLSCAEKGAKQTSESEAIKLDAYIPEVDSSFEVFDSKKYLPKINGKINYSKETEEYTLFGTEEFYGYQIDLYPNQSPFSIVKTFYKSGLIKMKGVVFNNGNFAKGKWYYFDQQGNIEKVEDCDAAYKFSFEDLNELLKSRKVSLANGYSHYGNKTSLFKAVNENGEPIYRVLAYITNRQAEFITIDGTSGKIIEVKEMKVAID